MLKLQQILESRWSSTDSDRLKMLSVLLIYRSNTLWPCSNGCLAPVLCLNRALSWAMTIGTDIETKQNISSHLQISPVATGDCMVTCGWLWPKKRSIAFLTTRPQSFKSWHRVERLRSETLSEAKTVGGNPSKLDRNTCVQAECISWI